MLQQLLEQNPKDSFARYGLALEYGKGGEVDAAIAEFRRILEHDANYVPAYQMAGQLLMQDGRNDEARDFLQKGVEIASRTGNVKALGEMEGLLDEIG